MHETDFLHEHAMTDDERAELARAIWSQENVELKTVGIDIGSSTSHLLFAKVALQRQSQGLSSRFVGHRPGDRLALADPADAVPARRHHRRARARRLHRTAATATPASRRATSTAAR